MRRGTDTQTHRQTHTDVANTHFARLCAMRNVTARTSERRRLGAANTLTALVLGKEIEKRWEWKGGKKTSGRTWEKSEKE